MNITSVQYVKEKSFDVETNQDVLIGENKKIRATINGVEMSVPLVPGNRHYDEIMRQVEAGTLTVASAPTSLSEAE